MEMCALVGSLGVSAGIIRVEIVFGALLDADDMYFLPTATDELLHYLDTNTSLTASRILRTLLR